MWMQAGFKRGTWISKAMSILGQKARTELIEEDTAGLQSSLSSKEPSPHLLQCRSFLESIVHSTEVLWKPKTVTESVPDPGSGRSRRKNTISTSRNPSLVEEAERDRCYAGDGHYMLKNTGQAGKRRSASGTKTFSNRLKYVLLN